MREKMNRLKNDITYILHRNDYPCEKTDNLATEILSLPSGYTSGKHVITVGEALEGYENMFDACKEFIRKCENREARSVKSYKQMIDALTFNGSRIVKKPIQSKEEKCKKK
jgi:hypothetical protein